MKYRLIFLVLIMTCFISNFYAQIKLVADGKVKIGNTANAPTAKLHIEDGNLRIENSQYSGIFIKSINSASQLRFQSSVGGFIWDDATGNTQLGRVEYNSGNNFMNFFNDIGGSFKFTTSGKHVTINDAGTSGIRLGIGTIGTPYNLSVVGNAGKTDGSSTWIVWSDKRLKSNIKDFNDGLEVLLKFRPVTFKYNGKYGIESEKEVVGVLAQDVKEIAPYMVKEYLLENIDEEIIKNGDSQEQAFIKEEVNLLGYDANALLYILVNSIQEQQVLIDTQRDQIDALIKDLETIQRNQQELDNSHDINIALDNVEKTDIAIISQSYPNPSNTIMSIDYFLPTNVTVAYLEFNDLIGNTILRKTIDSRGEGKINVDLKNIDTGIYSYTLFVNGNRINTYKFNVSK